MRSVGVSELLVIAVIFGVVMAGFWSRIFAKAGYSRWLGLTIVIPLVNLACSDGLRSPRGRFNQNWTACAAMLRPPKLSGTKMNTI
jgi:hypothetical protein